MYTTLSLSLSLCCSFVRISPITISNIYETFKFAVLFALSIPVRLPPSTNARTCVHTDPPPRTCINKKDYPARPWYNNHGLVVTGVIVADPLYD